MRERGAAERGDARNNEANGEKGRKREVRGEGEVAEAE